jgi:aerobic-type carbon monoxide dehydrogenase small subunit (CoxS/CutS family)
VKPTRLRLNGRPAAVDADPGTPLLWALRDALGLRGTKFGCGRGACGSCTVLRDGNPVKSCQVALADCSGAEIVTVEGLSADGAHPVQLAWLEEDVAQCGYCQAGMIMAAVGLLRRRPDPSDSDIDAALAEVVCRCGSYPRVRKAVHRAAALLRRGG